MSEGVKIGLSNLHYSIITFDTQTKKETYGTPVAVPGVTEAKLNPNASSDTLFADDGPAEVAATVGKISLELSCAYLTHTIQAALLGHTFTNGILTRKATDTPPWVAVGFKSLKSNGEYQYVWLTKGKFQLPEQTFMTKKESVNFQVPSITGNFVARELDGAWILEAHSDATGLETNTIADWFKATTLTPAA